MVIEFTNKNYYFSEPHVYNINVPPYNNFFKSHCLPSQFFRTPIYDTNNISFFSVDNIEKLQIFGISLENNTCSSKCHSLPIIIELQDMYNDVIGNFCHQSFIFYTKNDMVDILIELFFNHILILKNTIMVDNVDWSQCSDFWYALIEQSLINDDIKVYEYDNVNDIVLPLDSLSKFVEMHGPYLELSQQYKILISLSSLI